MLQICFTHDAIVSYANINDNQWINIKRIEILYMNYTITIFLL